MKIGFAILLGIMGLIGSWFEVKSTGVARPMEKRHFGTLPNNREVDLYLLTNKNGAQVWITNYGGIIAAIKVPDDKGKLGDVVLGFDSLDGYVNDKNFFGALIGRYGNRIAAGRFTLDGTTYVLARNNGENSLHGGILGFNKVLWRARDVTQKGEPALELKYLSKDGEEGYPGNLDVTVVYTWTQANELKIDYSATTDKKTVVNLTNHSYFNLAATTDSILQHTLMVEADSFTPVDAGLIPTGELRPVQGTPFDFRQPSSIGSRIEDKDAQLAFGKGYDHNFALNKKKPGSMTLAARVTEPKTHRLLEVWTTEPGLQFYSGNFLDGTIRGKGGSLYPLRSGFCLETQHFPDSPNHANFPATVLNPGERYDTTTIYKFSVQ